MDILNTTFAISQLNDESTRRQDARKRLDLYQGLQLPYVQDRLELHFSDVDKFSPTSLNIVKKVIDAKSQIYQRDAERIVSTVKDQALYDKVQDQCALGLRMRQANRLSKLCGCVFLKIIWRFGEIDIDIITPDICSVETGKSPRDIRSVVISYYPADGRVSELTHVRWTPGSIQTLDYNGNVTSTDANPYGFLPFVPIWSELPISDFWPYPGDSLVSTQEAINEKLTDLVYILRLQGFSIPVIKGAKTDLATFDPGQAISLPDDGSFSFEAPGNTVKSVLDSIDYLIRQIAVTEGLPASYLADKPSTRKSAAALVEQSKELQEIRANDVDLYKIYEKRVFETIKKVWNYHNSDKFSEKSALKINFFDPSQVDMDNKTEFWRRMVELGALSPVDLIKKMDSDLDDDEAQEKYFENQSLTQAQNEEE